MTEARRVVTVERGEAWEGEFARPRVVLQPIAAPSVLGLFGFAAATMMVAAHLAGWYGNAKTPGVLWPFASVVGGIAQFMAGMWAYRARDAVATAMHGVWGSFWIAYGILNIFVLTKLLPDVPPGSKSDPGFAFWFIVLAAITLSGALATLAESFSLFGTLAALTAGSAVFAAGLWAPSKGLVHLAGWLFVISAILAWYQATAMMLLAATGKTILPLFKLKREANVPLQKPVRAIELEWGEPGVKQGQ